MNKLYWIMTAFAVLAITPAAFAGDDDELMRTISVSAEGEMKAAPDKVDISLGLSEEARDLGEARDKVQKQLEALYKIADDLDIAKKDLETTYSAVQPQYDYHRETRKRSFRGYHVVHNVRVTLRDLDKLALFTDKILNAKIDEIQNTSFGLEEKDALYEGALKKALKTARSKADVLAKESGVEIGGVVSIAEGNRVIHQPRPMHGRAMMMTMAADSAESGGGSALPSGEIEVKATVSVVYELED